MKISFTFILLLFSFEGFAQQHTLPFPDSNAIWIQSRTIYDVNNQVYVPCHSKLFSHDTTNYNGFTYNNLYFEDYNFSPSDHFSFLWQSNLSQEKIGMFRTDSLKVYYKPTPNSIGYPCYTGAPYNDSDPYAEYILYDFGLNVGDTFYVQNNRRSVLVNIDSINIDGTYYRKFNFNQLDWWFTLDNYWIEGIGSSIGFFPYFSGHDGFIGFECFHEDTDPSLTYPLFSYSNSSIGCDFLGTNDIMKDPVKIYPNPAQSSLSVDIQSISSYQILSVSGQILDQGFLTAKNNSIDISILSEGYYLLRIDFRETIPFQKN